MKVTRILTTNIELDEKEYERLETEYDVLNQQYPNLQTIISSKKKKDILEDDFNINVTLELLRKMLNII